MGEALNEVLGSFLQLIVFVAVAALAWGLHRGWARLRKQSGQELREWLGLIRPQRPLGEALPFIGGLFLFQVALTGVEHFSGLGSLFDALLDTVPVAVLASIEGVPWALSAGLAYAFVRTGGSEEVLFRGVVFRRLVTGFGLLTGNLVYSVLFAALHNGIIEAALPGAPLGLHALLFLRVFTMSLVVGWYMEARDGGSLFVPWLVHGLANFLTFLTFLVPTLF